MDTMRSFIKSRENATRSTAEHKHRAVAWIDLARDLKALYGEALTS